MILFNFKLFDKNIALFDQIVIIFDLIVIISRPMVKRIFPVKNELLFKVLLSVFGHY
jgi:hypothetical protein